MLHIEQLTVSAFRGIPGEITLTCDAPLTVLCAPNGTGKTSICDAIEWLLTEHVQRLDRIEESVAATGWRCVFAKPETRTLVAASLVRGSNSLKLIRRHAPDSLAMVKGDAAEKQWQPGKLLDWLAPHAAPESLRANARIARQRHWLSSTHLLSAERFGVLLDADSRNQQARQELFADLLGVGELERTRSRVEKVSKELEKTDQKEREVLLSASLALSNLEKQLKQSGSFPDLGAVKRTVSEIVSDLRVSAITTADLQKDDSIGRIIGQLKEVVAAQKLAMDEAEPLWQTIESRLAFDEGRAAAVETARTELPVIRVQLANAREEIATLEEEIASLAEGTTSQTEHMQNLATSLAALHAAVPLVQDFVRRNQLADSPLGRVVEALESISASDFDDVIDSAERARDAAERMRGLQDRVIELEGELAKLPTDQVLREGASEAQKRLEAARQNKTRLEVDRESLNNAAERLVALGREIACRGTESGDCPLCGHEWGDVSTLLAAIDRVSFALGPQVASITSRLDEAATALLTVEKETERISIQAKQRFAFDSEVAILRSELRQYRALLLAARIESPQLPSAEFLSEFVASLRSRNAASQALQRLSEASPEFPSGFATRDCTSAFRDHEEALRSRLAAIAEQAKAGSLRRDAVSKYLAERRQTAAAVATHIKSLEALLSQATDMASRTDAAPRLPKSFPG